MTIENMGAIPDNLGESTDMLMNIKNEKSKLNRQIDELKKYDGDIKDYIFTEIPPARVVMSPPITGA